MSDGAGYDDVMLDLNDCEGSSYGVVPEEENEIIAALRKHVASGGTVDSLLDLTLISGGRLVIRASAVLSLFRTTAAQRAQNWRNAKRYEDEVAEQKRDAGYVPGSERFGA